MDRAFDYHWKNQLLFPVLSAASLLNGWLLQQPILLFIGIYFLGIICCKKQVVLFMLTVFCSFFLFLRIPAQAPPLPLEKELQTELTIFPDTIQINGDLVTFTAAMAQGDVRGQYKLTSAEEQQTWRNRKDWQQILLVKGTFREIEQQRNLHGFDQSWFFFTTDQLGTYVIAEILAQKPAASWLPLRKIRAAIIDWIEQQFPPKVSVYLWALLVGYRDRSFHELRDIYSGSGILHLFTISGTHVYLFYGWLFQVLRRSRLTFHEFGWFGLACIFSGIFLFGQEISIWRASLSYALSLFFRERRFYLSAMDRFSLVLLVLLLLDPKTLLQLSGILSLMMSWFIMIQASFADKWSERILQSQVISILAAPIFMYFFFELPLLGGLLTALCDPLFTFFLLPFGLLLCFFKVLSINSDGLLWLFEAGIGIFEGLLKYTKDLVVITGKPALLFVVLAVIAGLLLYQSKRKWLLVLPMIGLIGWQKISFETAVTFVDVGQGDSIVLQSPFKKEVFVIDTGGKMAFEREAWQQRIYRSGVEYTLLPFLKGEGITEIAGLFLTHGDADHMGDAAKLIAEIPVRWVYVGKGSLQHPSIQKLAQQLPARTKIREVEVNERIGKEIPLDVLAPAFIGKGENEDSLVLKTTIRKTRFLMTGDLDQAGERRLLRDYPDLQSDVIKLGHHGSRTSTDRQFIEQIAAKQGIVSAGKNNSFGHPHPEVLEVLQQADVQVFRTDQSGMIRYYWGLKNQQPKIWQAVEH